MRSNRAKKTYSEILDKVVEDTETFGVFAVLNVDKRANLRRLGEPVSASWTHEAREARHTSKEIWSFPTRISSSCLPTMFFFGQFVSSSLYTCERPCAKQGAVGQHVLDDLAGLDDPLHFLHHERAHPHCGPLASSAPPASRARTLFPDETVVAVVRVVRVPQAALRVLKLEELVPMLARVAGAAPDRQQMLLVAERERERETY
jgi:hypothetical protein